MAAMDELKDALRDALDSSGALERHRAALRADVLSAVRARVGGSAGAAGPPPAPPEANVLINELLREYLLWNGYREAASVLQPEASMPAAPALGRGFIASRLGLSNGEAADDLPLLYSLVARAGASKGVTQAGPRGGARAAGGEQGQGEEVAH